MVCLICTVLLLTPFVFYAGWSSAPRHRYRYRRLSTKIFPPCCCLGPYNSMLTHPSRHETYPIAHHPSTTICCRWPTRAVFYHFYSSDGPQSTDANGHEPAPLCLEQTLPECPQHSRQTLADGHPHVNWCLGCIGEVFFPTPTTGCVDPRVFVYPYPHLHKSVPMRYGYGFGWVRVQVWVFYLRVTQVIHYWCCCCWFLAAVHFFIDDGMVTGNIAVKNSCWHMVESENVEDAIHSGLGLGLDSERLGTW